MERPPVVLGNGGQRCVGKFVGEICRGCGGMWKPSKRFWAGGLETSSTVFMSILLVAGC